MEEITLKPLNDDYYKNELEKAIKELHQAQEDIKLLTAENDELKEQLNKISNEDEIVIRTARKIDNIEIYFKK